MTNDFQELGRLLGHEDKDLAGNSRKVQLCSARHAIWKYLSDKNINHQDIGDMCNRNRSTIYLGVKRFEMLLEVDDTLSVKTWHELKKIIKENKENGNN